MYIQAKHPTSAVSQLVEVVRVDRKEKLAHVRSTDPMTLAALQKVGRSAETTAVPLAWLTWIPCGPA